MLIETLGPVAIQYTILERERSGCRKAKVPIGVTLARNRNHLLADVDPNRLDTAPSQIVNDPTGSTAHVNHHAPFTSIKQFIRAFAQLPRCGQALYPFQERDKLLSLFRRVDIAEATDLWTRVVNRHLPLSFLHTRLNKLGFSRTL